jgi:alkylation response protein AidB-like acyl-CoA dehydrogenase
VDGGYRINGRKSWVTFAPALDYILTSATISGDDPSAVVGVFAVAGNAAGVKILDNWSTALSMRASGSCDIEYRDVFVPLRWLVETRSHADPPRTPVLPPAWSASAFASVYLGVGEAALATFASYARKRVPSALGKPISELPTVQRSIGQMDVILRAARNTLFDAAECWCAHPEQRYRMASDFVAAKYLCTNAAITVTEMAVRAAGANGLDRRLPLERYFRDARAGLMHPPQDDLALELMGRQVLNPV